MPGRRPLSSQWCVAAIGLLLLALLALVTLPTQVEVSAAADANVSANASATATAHAGGTADDVARAIDASAYAIVDLRTGRTVREQRAEWLDTPVWPGSIAKLATLAAAIDAGTLTDTTRIVCTRRVTLAEGRRADCSHPPVARGLSAVEAIARSCNLFAVSIARTLTRAQLAHGFVTMGLRPPPAGADLAASAIGLDGAKVAPRRLIEPVRRSRQRFREAPDAARVPGARILFDGLRESARHGTASAFSRAGLDALAKTGTAPMRGGRPLGLVAAVAPAVASPGAPRYAIVVALPGGSGAQAAETAAAILRPLLSSRPAARWQGAPAPVERPGATRPRSAAKLEPAALVTNPGRGNDALPARAAWALSTRPSPVPPVAWLRVGRPTSTGYAIEALAVEAYVAQVVAGETSSATPPAARDALAVTARTYAMVNRDRHRADGFDLCTLTHCQVARPASAASRAAAERTRGRLLTRDGRAAPVFYSASCGGSLADARVLLPDVAPGAMPWLTARPDPAGIAEKTWQTEIAARDLLAALRQHGLRGDVLRHLSAQAAADGMVTQVTAAGLTPSTLTGDAFRRAVGRQLGWQWLKSVRFTVDRTAAGYRFTGRGHGHGVGLCVLGASALATRGWDATRILHAYFPGLQVAVAPGSQARDDTPRAAFGGGPTTVRLRLPEAEERHRDRLLRLVDAGLRDLAARLDVPPPTRLAVVVHPTGDSYRRATRRPWWTSAATLVSGNDLTLHLVPLPALDRSGRLERTVRHELVHVLTVRALVDRPRWVHEGLASHFAGERVAVDLPEAPRVTGACPSDRELLRAADRAAFERAYDRAAACVARDLAAGRSWRDLGATPIIRR